MTPLLIVVQMSEGEVAESIATFFHLFYALSPPLPPPFRFAASVATATEGPGGVCKRGLAGWLGEWIAGGLALTQLPWLFQLSDSDGRDITAASLQL